MAATEVVTERRPGAAARTARRCPTSWSGTPTCRCHGPRPTLLWGYGGFTIPELANYRPESLGWLAAGGVLAIANLRGGGEFGRAWHDGGRLEHKQNVFDDFARWPSTWSGRCHHATSSWRCTAAATVACWSAR